MLYSQGISLNSGVDINNEGEFTFNSDFNTNISLYVADDQTFVLDSY